MTILSPDIYRLLQEYAGAEKLRSMLEGCGAYLEGHFILSSGLHVTRFFDMQRAFQHHLICNIFALHLYIKLPEHVRKSATLLAGPERGAWPLLLTLAHYLPTEDIRTLSLRKKADGGFELPPNAALKDNDQILLVDDVLTTGNTTRKAIEAFEAHPVIGAAFGVNRTPAEWDMRRLFPSISVTYALRDPQPQVRKEDCEPCRLGVEVVQT